jgi:hypothetical protein
MNNDRITVLGAGLQGVCVALALAQLGYRVNLFERMEDCLTQASLRNEGKIHLGFVYANDSSFQTADLMLRSALHFGPNIEAFLGQKVDWSQCLSNPFVYAIAQDSLLSTQQLMQHYQQLEKRYHSIIQDEQLHYLGARPSSLWSSLNLRDLSPHILCDRLSGAILSCERALDLVKFRREVRRALHGHPQITLHYGHTVESVQRTATGFCVAGTVQEHQERKQWRWESDIVVNCLWGGRLKVDREVGVEPVGKWVYRLKYRILGQTAEHLQGLPSVTYVLGPYGDVVTWPDSSTIYVSWYPVCMQGWSAELEPPVGWEPHCSGQVETPTQQWIAQTALSEFNRYISGLIDLKVDQVDAGIIFSWGETDIHDPGSELHKRHRVGVHAYDGYLSIDTAKFTCAPYFAAQAASLITAGF